MAVQEALILPLRASSPSSGFAKVSLSLSLRACVCQSCLPPCLPSPPLSLIPLSACLSCACASPSRFSSDFSLFLALSALPFSPLSQPSLLVFLAGQDDKKKFKLKKKKGRLLLFLLQTKKAFVVACSLVWPVVFSSSLPPPLVCFLVLPRCPPLSLAGACVASSRLWQAERRKMKAQSSKMHQHEY